MLVLIHTFKDKIRRFPPLQFFRNSEVCLEPSQLSMIAYFAKIINGWKLSTIFTKYSVIDIWLVPDIVKISFSSTTTKRKDVMQDLLKDLKKYTDSNHLLILSNERFLRKSTVMFLDVGDLVLQFVWILYFEIIKFWVFLCSYSELSSVLFIFPQLNCAISFYY